MDVLTERTANIVLDDDEDDDEDDDDEQLPVDGRVRLQGSRQSLSHRRLTQSKASSRRRRRSSARFIKLPATLDYENGDYDDYEDDDSNHHASSLRFPSSQQEDLGQVYQNAIRMNAENKINASNSWNLNLIDHMDRFLTTNTTTSAGGSNGGPVSNVATTTMQDTLGNTLSGVNFTKASCTLDASVKIYSYRVDDVHLTSYKVLANLNRTDTNSNNNNNSSGKHKSKAGAHDGSSDVTRDDDDDDDAREERRTARSNTETLETNLGKCVHWTLRIGPK